MSHPRLTTSRISRDSARRLKVLGAVRGQSVHDLLDEILASQLDRLEREHCLSRYRSSERARPARSTAD